MIIEQTPETEARLLQKAERDGKDVNSTADSMLADYMRWEEEDRDETIEGIRRGLEASDAGRVRPFEEFAAEMRAKYKLPTHLTDAELGVIGDLE